MRIFASLLALLLFVSVLSPPGGVASRLVRAEGAGLEATAFERKSAASGLASEHWAFVPPRAVGVPSVAHEELLRGPVDAFLLRSLESKGLTFAPVADRRTLLRRVSYDLTGLPPGHADVEAFVADPEPEAWEKVVDRLLASPRHGERWARHWLDIARYADTKGYVYDDREEARFVHSASFRDWVIGSLDEDQPYDRFLLEQIAGDQLASEDDPAPLAAMGLLTLGRRFINNPHDIIDDRIDTVTRATMALTVACSRCHDHKFDPIPTTDYYALYGVLASSSERMVSLASTRDRARDGWEAFEAELEKRERAYQELLAKETEKLLESLRADTPRYLEAVLEVDSLPTEEFYQIFGADELRPFVVRRWHRHVLREVERDSTVFSAWGAFAALDSFPVSADETLDVLGDRVHPAVRAAFAGRNVSSMRDVTTVYGELFASVHRRWKERSATGAERFPDAADESLRRVLYGEESPIATPEGSFNEIEWFWPESARVAMGRSWREIERWILASDAAPPYASCLVDRERPVEPRVFLRGNPATPGARVTRHLPAILGGDELHEGSGRLELARAIASERNPLTARVAVNRSVLHLFGEGLVATPSDFGLRGETPSHPDLLDWLALHFIEEGWSRKRLRRELVLSRAYQQSSAVVPAAVAMDPGNRLRWRMPLRRLDFESLRDTMLVASGRLDTRVGGRSIDLTARPFSPRRAVYGFVDRLNIPGVFRAFDVAAPDQHAPRRHETTVPQQALWLLNGPFLLGEAESLAARGLAGSPEDRVRTLYRIVFARDPRPDEIRAGVRFARDSTGEIAESESSPWSHGVGSVDEATGRVSRFEPLPHFTGTAWQGSDAWPDARLGWVTLNARGGHVGNDLDHMAIRRFTAPVSGTLTIRGRLAHEQTDGDGVRARIISGRGGTLGEWRVHHAATEIELEVDAEHGETIDFVVDCGPAGNITWDEFFWAPTIREVSGGDEWSAERQFGGPAPRRLSDWERYAQTLLMTNELAIVD